jgi:biopolymer transport protein ExbD
MYRPPSRSRKTKQVEKPSLTSLLDSAFIFIFFLLYYATFVHFFEIVSDVPAISDKEPPKKPPLALMVKVTPSQLEVFTGVPSMRQKVFGKLPDNSGYDFLKMREYLFQLKNRNLEENTAILEPSNDIAYDDLVKVMDAIRNLKKTDPEIYVKGKDGVDKKLNELFGQIVFGNIQS